MYMLKTEFLPNVLITNESQNFNKEEFQFCRNIMEVGQTKKRLLILSVNKEGLSFKLVLNLLI